MPYRKPNIAELVKSGEADLDARLGSFARLRRRVLGVIVKVAAGLVYGLYGYLCDYLAKQVFPWSAEREHLEAHAAWWGVRRKPAASALGRAVFRGRAGACVPAGHVLKSAGGRLFKTVRAASIDAGCMEVAAAVKALEPGAASNLEGGARLDLVSPAAGVESAAWVGDDGLTGGEDEESDKALAARLEERTQNPPQGGNEQDYALWAKEVAGVTRAWVYGNHVGPGTVGVTFVCDGQPEIIPCAEKIAEVQVHLSKPATRPVTADVHVFAPAPQAVLVRVAGLNPADVKVQAAVCAELAAFFAREAAPGRRILISRLRQAISAAAGEYDHTLLEPLSNIIPEPYALLVLAGVEFDD